MKLAVCPGSFDPITNGHIDIIKRASKIFDRIIVLILINPSKMITFSVEERMAFVKTALKDVENAEVEAFSGLLADYVSEKKAVAIVKGLRAVSDFEYEFQMALANKKLNPAADTIFLTAEANNMYLSSSLIKQIAKFGGDISEFLPAEIVSDVKKKLTK